MKKYTVSQYQNFFMEKYGKNVFSKCRKRELVFLRKLIALFLIDNGFNACFVAKILKVHHAVILYYKKPVIDFEFDRFFVPRARDLKEDFYQKFPEDGPK